LAQSTLQKAIHGGKASDTESPVAKKETFGAQKTSWAIKPWLLCTPNAACMLLSCNALPAKIFLSRFGHHLCPKNQHRTFD
jgi:hypothetical protein